MNYGLESAGLGTYEAGQLSAGPLRPLRESFGSTEIDPEAAIGEVALAVLRRQFAALLAREAGARKGDIEALHDMRVASRRLRAALSLFANVLPAGVVETREELGWVGRALGGVRDLDVQLEQLDEWLADAPEPDAHALAALRSLLEDQRRVARAAMLETLDSPRYESFVSGFGRTLRSRHQSRSAAASLPSRAVAPDLIERRFRRFRKCAEGIGPDSSATEYHGLRIRAKRLRYTLEFLADVYPNHTRPVIERLVALQDILGLHQDADVAIGRLRRLSVEHGAELSPGTIFAMGGIAERYRQSMAGLRAQFPAAYARLTGKNWRSLRKLIEAQRLTVPARTDAPAAATDAGARAAG